MAETDEACVEQFNEAVFTLPWDLRMVPGYKDRSAGALP